MKLNREMQDILAKEAEENQMGVRYLNSRIQELLDEQMFLDSEKKNICWKHKKLSSGKDMRGISTKAVGKCLVCTCRMKQKGKKDEISRAVYTKRN